ncbi:MAG TPA: GFA family protein [Burkholderiales bacterium]|nr:GFA family protein [Burkholderiales bacterium]
MKVHGGCHCGRIAFEGELDPARVGVCHCTDCQSLSGSAFTVYAQVQREAFRLLRGEPKVYVKTAESGNRRAQAFCADCGSRLWAAAEKDTPLYNLRVGTLRERAELRPQVQLWCRSAMPWLREIDAVPKKMQGA